MEHDHALDTRRGCMFGWSRGDTSAFADLRPASGAAAASSGERLVPTITIGDEVDELCDSSSFAPEGRRLKPTQIIINVKQISSRGSRTSEPPANGGLPCHHRCRSER